MTLRNLQNGVLRNEHAWYYSYIQLCDGSNVYQLPNDSMFVVAQCSKF